MSAPKIECHWDNNNGNGCNAEDGTVTNICCHSSPSSSSQSVSSAPLQSSPFTNPTNCCSSSSEVVVPVELLPDDAFSTIRRHCKRHLRRLERYRKARSFCSLLDDDEKDNNSNNTQQQKQNGHGAEEMEKQQQHKQCKLRSSSCQQPNSAVKDGRKGEEAVDVGDIVDGVAFKQQGEQNDQQQQGKQEDDKQLHHLSQQQPPLPPHHDDSRKEQFEEMREKMLTLVENDMVLLTKLLSLGDSLRQLRQRQLLQRQQQQLDQDHQYDDDEYNNRGNVDSSNNASSPFATTAVEADKEELDECAERMDECRPLQQRLQQHQQQVVHFGRQRRQRQPIPAEFAGREVIRLYVNNEREEADEAASVANETTENEEDGEDTRPNVQYFSRKNSILRIPIPPRASNRAFARSKKHNSCAQTAAATTKKSLPNESEEHQQQQDQHIPRSALPPSMVETSSVVTESPELDSGHSSTSEHSPAPLKQQQHLQQQCQSRFSTLSSGLSTQSSLSCCSSLASTTSSNSSRNRFSMIPRASRSVDRAKFCNRAKVTEASALLSSI